MNFGGLEYYENNLLLSKLALIIEKIERRIESINGRLYIYEIKGMQTSIIEQRLDKLIILLAFYEHQYNQLINRNLVYGYGYYDDDDIDKIPELVYDEDLYDEENEEEQGDDDEDYIDDETEYDENEKFDEEYLELEVTAENNVLENQNSGFDNNINTPDYESNDDNQLVPNWVDENKQLGDFGEKIALKYLIENVSKEITSVSHLANKGYDLEHKLPDKIVGYEIKTSSTQFSGFFITINELSKAATMKENYKLFYLKVNSEKGIVKGFIISNPIETLNINYNELIKTTQMATGSIVPTKFFYTFSQSFIETVSMITLHDNM